MIDADIEIARIAIDWLIVSMAYEFLIRVKIKAKGG